MIIRETQGIEFFKVLTSLLDDHDDLTKSSRRIGFNIVCLHTRPEARVFFVKVTTYTWFTVFFVEADTGLFLYQHISSQTRHLSPESLCGRIESHHNASREVVQVERLSVRSVYCINNMNPSCHEGIGIGIRKFNDNIDVETTTNHDEL